MDDKFLKHRKDGTIFGWTELLAKHPDLMEVTPEEAYPEKFMPKKVRARAAANPKPVVIGDVGGEQERTPENDELNRDASQGLPE